MCLHFAKHTTHLSTNLYAGANIAQQKKKKKKAAIESEEKIRKKREANAYIAILPEQQHHQQQCILSHLMVRVRASQRPTRHIFTKNRRETRYDCCFVLIGAIQQCGIYEPPATSVDPQIEQKNVYFEIV